MAHHYGYSGEPLYVSYPDLRFDRDGRQYYEIAPVTFREPPFYDDVVYYRRSFRDHHPDDGRHHGGLIPREQVLIQDEDPSRDPSGRLWLLARDFPHGGHNGHRFFIDYHCSPSVTIELYAPQLCCDSCERRVTDSLSSIPGVENVTADQWKKKVVVLGRGLEPDVVLRRLQRVRHMGRSVFWNARPH